MPTAAGCCAGLALCQQKMCQTRWPRFKWLGVDSVCQQISPGNTFALTPLPVPTSPVLLPLHIEHSSSFQNVIFSLLFRTCISVEHEVSQMLSWIASKEASISSQEQDQKKKKNSISGFWQLVRKICWVILIFFPKRKNRWGFTFYLVQTLCSPRPFLYLSTLKFGGFSAKLKEFHNCSRIL